MSGEMTRKES